MPISYISQIPKRNTQGTKLSSLQHDDIHEQLRATINALIDEINGLTVGGGGGSAPTGTVLEYAGSILPTGYLWANGQAVSRTLYATLFSTIGTTFGAGDNVTTFNVPNHIGRVASGTNPMGGVTEIGLSLRTLGDAFGNESVSYTPSGSVSQASIASLTATCSSIDTSGLLINAIDLQSLVNGFSATSTSIDISSLTATCDAISIAGLTATCGTISIASLTNDITLANGALSASGNSISVTGAACFNVQSSIEVGVSVMDCASPLVVSSTNIASELITNVSIASASIGGSIPSPTITLAGSIPTPTITIGGSIPAPAIAINPPTAINISVAGAIPTPSITLGGSIPSQTFTGAPDNITVLQPSIAMNFIIKY
jgi:microcystin-dependent protein